MLLRSPNTTLAADNVKLTINPAHGDYEKEIEKGAIIKVTDIYEGARQPFPEKIDLKQFFFRSGQSFKIQMYRDPKGIEEGGPGLLKKLEGSIADGTMELTDFVHVDSTSINEDPTERKVNLGEWERELNKIGHKLR